MQFSIAQTVYRGNLYPYYKYTLNSAYAGADGHKSLFLDYRNASNSIQGSPTQMMFAYSMPVFNNMGLGVRLQNHTEGLIGFFTGLVDYSYFVTLNNNQNLRFGISGGISNSRLDNSKIMASDPSAIMEIASKYFLGTTFESAAGIVYQWDNLSFELSAPRLFGTDKGFKPNFSSSLIYNFYTLDNQVVLQPSVLLLYQPSTPLVYDINLTAEIKQNFMIGIGYRNRPGIVLSAGLLFDEIKVFYAAELGIGNYSNLFNTIHEISVGYTFKKVKKALVGESYNPPLDVIVKTDSISSESITEINKQDSITDISNEEIITDINTQDSITDIFNQEIITDIDTQDSITDISNQEGITEINKQDSINDISNEESTTDIYKQDSITDISKQDSITAKLDDKVLDLKQDSVANVRKDSASTREKKSEFEIVEVGNGVYELKPLSESSEPINENQVDDLLKVEMFIGNEDVRVISDKDNGKIVNNSGNYEIIEVGSGIYSIKENGTDKYTKDIPEKLIDSLYTLNTFTSGHEISAKSIITNDKGDYFHEVYYTVQVFITSKSNIIMKDYELAEQLRVERSTSGKINYYYGKFSEKKSAEQARNYLVKKGVKKLEVLKVSAYQ